MLLHDELRMQMTTAGPGEGAGINIKDTFITGRKHNGFDFPSRDDHVNVVALDRKVVGEVHAHDIQLDPFTLHNDYGVRIELIPEGLDVDDSDAIPHFTR